ncbi:MAG: hypothetical protein CVU24_00615 [Betaproteobacteria bacterium HGW-Betaproteobacteria-18]|jgi:hypothetical protein|nr:MAG: hypothetical protein CVU24_00615 [Betaproteobacteria bacterium HGW-Betaproteobacteria-18]
MKYKILISIATLFLAGCGTNFIYNIGNKTYDDPDDFIKAGEANNLAVKRAILPLQKKLTDKKLIIVFASRDAIVSNSTAQAEARVKKKLNEDFIENHETMATYTVNGVKNMYEAASVKGIYSHVVYRETNTLANSLAPAADYDTLAWYQEAGGVGQWFYSSAKYGKQLFVFDQTSNEASVKTEAFLSALQALAIRD